MLQRCRQNNVDSTINSCERRFVPRPWATAKLLFPRPTKRPSSEQDWKVSPKNESFKHCLKHFLLFKHRQSERSLLKLAEAFNAKFKVPFFCRGLLTILPEISMFQERLTVKQRPVLLATRIERSVTMIKSCLVMSHSKLKISTTHSALITLHTDDALAPLALSMLNATHFGATSIGVP